MQDSQVNIINGQRQYVMFDLFRPNRQIWYWDNVISSPKELLKFINDIDKDSRTHSIIQPWQRWTASDDQNLEYGATKNIFTGLEINTGDEKLNQRCLYIINSLKMAIEMCYERYLSGFNLNLSDYFLDKRVLPVKKWNAGQSMGPHFDGQDGHTDLAFSMVTYLNDDYEGGEIFFPNHNIKIKPKPGSLIMFPSQEPFIHEVLPIQSGTRYMMTTSIFSLKKPVI